MAYARAIELYHVGGIEFSAVLDDGLPRILTFTDVEPDTSWDKLGDIHAFRGWVAGPCLNDGEVSFFAVCRNDGAVPSEMCSLKDLPARLMQSDRLDDHAMAAWMSKLDHVAIRKLRTSIARNSPIGPVGLTLRDEIDAISNWAGGFPDRVVKAEFTVNPELGHPNTVNLRGDLPDDVLQRLAPLVRPALNDTIPSWEGAVLDGTISIRHNLGRYVMIKVKDPVSDWVYDRTVSPSEDLTIAEGLCAPAENNQERRLREENPWSEIDEIGRLLEDQFMVMTLRRDEEGVVSGSFRQGRLEDPADEMPQAAVILERASRLFPIIEAEFMQEFRRSYDLKANEVRIIKVSRMEVIKERIEMNYLLEKEGRDDPLEVSWGLGINHFRGMKWPDQPNNDDVGPSF